MTDKDYTHYNDWKIELNFHKRVEIQYIEIPIKILPTSESKRERIKRKIKEALKNPLN